MWIYISIHVDSTNPLPRDALFTVAASWELFPQYTFILPVHSESMINQQATSQLILVAVASALISVTWRIVPKSILKISVLVDNFVLNSELRGFYTAAKHIRYSPSVQTKRWNCKETWRLTSGPWGPRLDGAALNYFHCRVSVVFYIFIAPIQSARDECLIIYLK